MPRGRKKADQIDAPQAENTLIETPLVETPSVEPSGTVEISTQPVFSEAARLWHSAFIGKTGSGKTYAARGEVEDLIDLGRQVVIIDPTGAWHGLRLNLQGQPSGYNIAIFGGSFGDKPLTPDMAPALGRIAGTTDRSMILDLSGISLELEDQREIVYQFLRNLYRTNRKPIHLIIDEADEFCLSEDTEILTINGWKTYDLIKEGDLVSCFDLENESYSYQPIQRVIVLDYDGPMVHLKTRSLDCLATPDHRVVLRREQRGKGRYKKYPWTFERSINVPQQIDIPLGGADCGSGIEGLSLEDFRIIGWIITDGTLHDRRSKNPSYCISQSLATKKNGVFTHQQMQQVLEKLEGVSQYERTRYNHPGIKSTAIVTERRWYMSVKCSEKYAQYLGKETGRIPRIILENANKEQLESLYKGIVEGDGTYIDGNWKTLFCGHSEGLADDFQELCLKLRVRASTSKPKVSGQWHVRIGKGTHHTVRKPAITHYKGKVWDVTVPTGAFVARRNGKPFVTGNCPQELDKETKTLRTLVARIMARGRSLGFRCTLITQRPAKIDKNSISQIESMAVLRVTAPQDRTAIVDWFADKGGADRKEILNGLGSLQTGEGWVFTGLDGTYDHRRFRKLRTYDSSSTPTDENGNAIILDTGPIDLSEFDEQLIYPDDKDEIELEKTIAKRRNLEEDNKKLRARLLKSEARYEAMRTVFVNIRTAIDIAMIDNSLEAVDYADMLLLRNEVAADHAETLGLKPIAFDMNDIVGAPDMKIPDDIKDIIEQHLPPGVVDEKSQAKPEIKSNQIEGAEFIQRKLSQSESEVILALDKKDQNTADLAKNLGISERIVSKATIRLHDEKCISQNDRGNFVVNTIGYARMLSEIQTKSLQLFVEDPMMAEDTVKSTTLLVLKRLGLVDHASRITSRGHDVYNLINDAFLARENI